MIQKAKGTYDVYGKLGREIIYLENLMKSMMEKYHYEYIKTPIFESSELFHRGVGETTDIVTKETYDFIDRGNRNMTLRPEGTAGVVRSYIENKMYGEPSQPKKLWYFGPMYRYERPQSGRFREFFQFGAEVFGLDSPMIDAEVISIPVNFYRLLGLKGIKVGINSLGDDESRNNYREALLEHFKPHLDNLCEDCQNRYLKNPLRILDCKIDGNQECMHNAPKTIDYLNESSKKHFEDVQSYLNELEIEYEVNPSIVRGLDYYNHTVFEVEANIEGFGSQNVLCGGGRYNKLVETIGGPSTPGVGFAMGLERLISALEFEKIQLSTEKLDVFVIPMSEEENHYAFSLVQDLRMNGFKTDLDYLNRNLKGSFKQADRFNSSYVIIIGNDEREKNILTVKDNETKEQYKISKETLIDFLDEHLEEE